MNQQDLELKAIIKRLGETRADPAIFYGHLYLKAEKFETPKALLDEIEIFANKCPNYFIENESSVGDKLCGWTIRSVLDGEEIGRYLTISIENLHKSEIDLSKIIQDSFMKNI